MRTRTWLISILFGASCAAASACVSRGEALTANDPNDGGHPEAEQLRPGDADVTPDSPPDSPARPGNTVPADAISITVEKLYCGAASNKCYGEVSYDVDFGASRLTTTTCAENPDGGGVLHPAIPRSLTPAEAARVRDALASVRWAPGKIEAVDGPMSGLSVTTAGGEKTMYSPSAACGDTNYNQVVEGWDNLWSVVSTL